MRLYGKLFIFVREKKNYISQVLGQLKMKNAVYTINININYYIKWVC
jgi:hypothetical protein